MDEQLVKRIVKDLGKQRSRNEIIREVCEQSGLNWPEAEQLVQQVAQEHGRTIARRQSPLMILLSVGTLLIGVFLLLQSLEFFMAFFQGETVQQILSLRGAYLRIIGGLTGIGMLVGGILGVWNTVTPLLEE